MQFFALACCSTIQLLDCLCVCVSVWLEVFCVSHSLFQYDWVTEKSFVFVFLGFGLTRLIEKSSVFACFGIIWLVDTSLCSGMIRSVEKSFVFVCFSKSCLIC